VLTNEINLDMGEKILLQVDNLDSYYGHIQALSDVSLEVKAGEIVAVIGANGAGKTTLLRAISGVTAVSSGEIWFNGKQIDNLSPEEIVPLGISHVPERRELFDSLTVMDNLLLGAYHRWKHGHRAEIANNLEKMWEIFPILRSRQEQMAGTLSGGEQQMVAIARGLMAKPKLLLIDEPSLGLAPLLVQEILRIIMLLRDTGRTVLLVEQNASGAFEIADRAYLLEVGRVVLQGQASELMKDERVRRAYIGQGVARSYQIRDIKPSKGDRNYGGNQRKRQRRKVKGSREEEINLMDTLSDSLSSFTLPDEYFQQRIGYTIEEIQDIQDRALPKAFDFAFENSRLYRHKFSEIGLKQGSIRGLSDLTRLPFTTSEEIQSTETRGSTSKILTTVDPENVSLVHTSSGTTGSPKIFAYTGKDISHWSANTATVFWINGFRKTDIVQSVMPFGEFTGGGGLYLGMLALGVTYLPMSLGTGVTEKVMAHLLGKIMINDHEIPIDPLLRANGLVCLGSFLPRLEEMLDEYHVQPGELSLTKISAGAEPSSDAVRTRFAERFGLWPRDNYGLGEFYGPGVAGECDFGGALHVLSDTFIAEVIDPETEELTPEGEMGELVLTSLHKEAVPLFRYRTGDRVMVLPNDCPCGMAHRRIGRVPGRIDSDDIVIPGGVIVNRTYLEDIILQIDGVGTEYVLTVAEHPSRKGLQRLYIAIEGDSDPKLAEKIGHRIKVEYNQSPYVTLLPLGSIPRTLGKAKRIISPDQYRDLVDEYLRE
jgi:branched-chain amino acid transport system ATP-binding protein